MSATKVELTCEVCGTKRKFRASSPAAPFLTAAEESVKYGWSFENGFQAMLTGDYHNRCPNCKNKEQV